MVHVNSRDWCEKLNQSVESHKSVKGFQNGHQYIIFKDKEYVLGKVGSKLSVNEITEISNRVILNLKQEISNQNLSISKLYEYKQLATDIEKNTIAIIDFREAKRNTPHLLFFRGVALVISVVTSLVIIGIPFLILIQQKDTKFKNEIAKLKEIIFLSKQKLTADLNNVKKDAESKQLEELKKKLLLDGCSEENADKMIYVHKKLNIISDSMEESEISMEELKITQENINKRLEVLEQN